MLIKNINELLEHHVYYGQGYGKECVCCVVTAGKDGHLWMKRDLSKTRHEEYYDPEGFSFIGMFADDLPEYNNDGVCKTYSKSKTKKYRVLTIEEIDKMVDDKRKYQNKDNKDQKQGYKKKDKKSSSLEKNKKKFGGAK